MCAFATNQIDGNFGKFPLNSARFLHGELNPARFLHGELNPARFLHGQHNKTGPLVYDDLSAIISFDVLKNRS